MANGTVMALLVLAVEFGLLTADPEQTRVRSRECGGDQVTIILRRAVQVCSSVHPFRPGIHSRKRLGLQTVQMSVISR